MHKSHYLCNNQVDKAIWTFQVLSLRRHGGNTEMIPFVSWEEVSAIKWLNYRFVKSLPRAVVSLSAFLERVPEGSNKWKPWGRKSPEAVMGFWQGYCYIHKPLTLHCTHTQAHIQTSTHMHARTLNTKRTHTEKTWIGKFCYRESVLNDFLFQSLLWEQ